MNVAQPRTWSPRVVLFAIVLHAVVFYFVAVSFRIVPPPVDVFDPPTIRAVTFTPPPPAIEVEPEPIVKRPVFEQRPTRPPIVATVPPTPFTPTATPSQAGPTSIDVRQQIQETPIVQPLPRYPIAAQERGIEGRVIMSITIMADGSVRDVRVVGAQPRGTFESTAVRAVQSWRYRPSNVVRTNVIVHMDFELRDT